MNKKINVNLFFLILIILCLIVFIFPYFAFGQTSGSSPKRGEWLCCAIKVVVLDVKQIIVRSYDQTRY